jgi:anti-sigma factor RsiW
MLTCHEAQTLIMRATDGTLDAVSRDRLLDHITECSPCRAAANGQTLVRTVLSTRLDVPLPVGFTARLAAHLDQESSADWLESVNWRAWCIRLLPAAGILWMFAGIVRRSEQADQHLTDALLRMLANGHVADAVLERGASGETLMGAVLLGQEPPETPSRQ